MIRQSEIMVIAGPYTSLNICKSIKFDEVNQKIDQVARMQTALDQLIAACQGKGGLQACSIMEAMMVTENSTPTKGKKK